MKYVKMIRRETKVLVLVIVMLLVVVLGVSYSIFIQTKSNTNNQVVTTGTLEVEYSSKNGYIQDDDAEGIIPKANNIALKEEGYEFSVKNTGSYSITYNVYLYVNEADFNKDKADGKVSGELFTNLDLLKYNITTNDDNNSDIEFLSDQYIYKEEGIEKYQIYQGTIAGNNDINKHVLKIWMSEDATVAEIGKYIYLKLEVASYITGQEPSNNKTGISVIAKDSNGQDLNASATEITGNNKQNLLDSLEATGFISSKSDVDALIEVKSDDFEDIAQTEFDVSSIANPGDKVIILHFDEEKQKWEFINEDTVDENGKVEGDFSSYSPVAFVVVKNDGTFENVDKFPKCISAKKLHTEICDAGDSNSYCGADSEKGSLVTYGNLVSGSTLLVGDALTCDVNGDGQYRNDTERFYYISDLEGDSNNAVLVYYNNVSGGVPNNAMGHAYASKEDYVSSGGTEEDYQTYGNWDRGPVSAKLQLPTTEQWSNVSLKNTVRNIKDKDGVVRVSNFSYEGYAARLLTIQEVYAGCDIGEVYKGSLIPKCKFLLENTRYTSYQFTTFGGWLETPYIAYQRYVYRISGRDRGVDYDALYATTLGGVRPVIEVAKSDIQLN